MTIDIPEYFIIGLVQFCALLTTLSESTKENNKGLKDFDDNGRDSLQHFP